MLFLKGVIIEIIYIFFGWLLGLLSPTIINSIKSKHERIEFFGAAKSELSELQLQICITGMLLAQRYGNLNKDYLEKTKATLSQYKGEEKAGIIIKYIDELLKASDDEFKAIEEHLKATDGVGLSLKSHSTILLDSNAVQVSKLPIELQSKIYLFKNSLNIFNQEIEAAKRGMEMTFDSSISDENHRRVKKGLLSRYADLQGVCVRVSDKIQQVLDYEL